MIKNIPSIWGKDPSDKEDIAKLALEHPNVHRTIQEIVEAEGFNFENHTVITEDGYILEMHRIFANLTNEIPDDIIRPVLFM